MKIKLLVLIILFTSLVSAATLEGNVYDENLDLAENVLIQINQQKFLSKDGSYSFELALGNYLITVKGNNQETTESVTIKDEGKHVLDLFLLPDFLEEDELWQDLEYQLEVSEELNLNGLYLIIILILVFIVFRFLRVKKQSKLQPHQENNSLNKVLEILKENDGRITQKDLRKELFPLSEAKVSLMVTELENKGQVKRIKQGRGKIILLTN